MTSMPEPLTMIAETLAGASPGAALAFVLAFGGLTGLLAAAFKESCAVR